MFNGRIIVFLATEENDDGTLTPNGQARVNRTMETLNLLGIVPDKILVGDDPAAVTMSAYALSCLGDQGARPSLSIRADLSKNLREGEHIVSADMWRTIKAEAKRRNTSVCDLLHEGKYAPEVLYARAKSLLKTVKESVTSGDTECMLVIVAHGQVQHAISSLLERKTTDLSFRVATGEVSLLETNAPRHTRLKFVAHLGGIHTPGAQLLLPCIEPLRTILTHAPKA